MRRENQKMSMRRRLGAAKTETMKETKAERRRQRQTDRQSQRDRGRERFENE